MVFMNRSAFSELRVRDDAIEQARRDYHKTVAEIADIELKLFGKSTEPKKCKTAEAIPKVVASLIPTDRAFTISEMCALVHQKEPTRTFTKDTVAAALHLLVRDGTIKRISSGSNRATFAHPSLEIDPAKTIEEWAVLALNESSGPLTKVELIVAMVDKGYHLQTTQNRAVAYVNKKLRATGQFVKTGQKWANISQS